MWWRWGPTSTRLCAVSVPECVVAKLPQITQPLITPPRCADVQTGTEWREGYAAYMQRRERERAMEDLRFRFRKMVDAGRHTRKLSQHPGMALMAEELIECQQNDPESSVTYSTCPAAFVGECAAAITSEQQRL